MEIDVKIPPSEVTITLKLSPTEATALKRGMQTAAHNNGAGETIVPAPGDGSCMCYRYHPQQNIGAAIWKALHKAGVN